MTKEDEENEKEEGRKYRRQVDILVVEGGRSQSYDFEVMFLKIFVPQSRA